MTNQSRKTKERRKVLVTAAPPTGADPSSASSTASARRFKDAGITEHYENGHHILRCDRWCLKLDDYRVTAEVIDRRIYHVMVSGTFRECHVEPVTRLRESVRRMIGLEEGFVALVSGFADMHTSDYKVRKQYMASLRRWHQRYPIGLYIFYNASRWVRTAAMLAIPFMPFKVKVTQDLAGALALVDRFDGPPDSTAVDGPPPADSFAEDPVHVVHQLLKFIGDIDWERRGAAISDVVEKDHPFLPVFDAIALIKRELDAVFEDRRGVENALRESQQRFDEVLIHSRDILFKRDLQKGSYDYVSDAVSDLWGTTPEAICRMGFAGVRSLVHPEDLERFLAFDNKLRDTDDPPTVDHEFEYRLRDNRGRYRWFSESDAIVSDAEGRAVGVIGSTRDISRIKALEAERQEIAERLRHTRKLEAVNTMAGGVAHNFNNLLMVVLGNLELMREKAPQDSRLHRNIDAIEKSARRAADLSTLMLTYVGQAEISPQVIDLNLTLSETVDVLKTTMAQKACLNLARADSPAWIHADAAKLYQVIANLVTNAVEACGDRSPEVHLGVGFQYCDGVQLSRLAPGESLPEGHYVWLRVADNGQGMDHETLEKVFDPFFTTKFTGRGLGMAAVMGIMRTHRGGIRIDSRPDAGTAVTVYFPQRKPSLAAESTAPSAAAPAQRRGTALIVDDEPLVLELGKQMLARLGFEVLTATDGVDALAVFEANRQQVRMAVLDINMPRMDGRETLERLRATGAIFPVLVTSGFTEAQALERMGGACADGYIQKPFRMDQLRKIVESVLK